MKHIDDLNHVDKHLLTAQRPITRQNKSETRISRGISNNIPTAIEELNNVADCANLS